MSKPLDLSRYDWHTPGDWIVHPKAKANVLAIETGFTVASCGGWNDSSIESGYIEREQHANARLIADAPALLAEVVKLRAELEQVKCDAQVAESVAHRDGQWEVWEQMRGENEKLRKENAVLRGYVDRAAVFGRN